VTQEMAQDRTRTDELEIRLAHQEKAIAELGEMVAAQWKKIDALERQLKRLDEEVRALDQDEVPNQRPPHY
jgi:SlyX protein